MGRRSPRVTVAGIAVEVVRKRIRNLHLRVVAPDGDVRVSAPLAADDAAVRRAVLAHLEWIRRKRAELARRPRAAPRELVTGEGLVVAGHPHRLAVVEAAGPPGVRRSAAAEIELRVPPGSDRALRAAVLERWQRRELAARLPPLLATWEPRVGVEVAEVRIRRMRTRWGTCNAAARRIWLSLMLAEKPLACVEYVLVHEMVHFFEPRHDEGFRKRMDALMPAWRQLRAELDGPPDPPPGAGSDADA